jgi:hypothetical protein
MQDGQWGFWALDITLKDLFCFIERIHALINDIGLQSTLEIVGILALISLGAGFLVAWAVEIYRKWLWGGVG